MKKYKYYYSAFLLSVVLLGRADVNDSLSAMHDKYAERLKLIDLNFEKEKRQVFSGYESELNLLENKLKLKGDLDGLLTIRNELARLTGGGLLSGTNVLSSQSLLSEIQKDSIKKLEALDHDRRKAVLKLWGQYDAALSAMEIRYTKSDEVANALLVRKEREQVKDSPVVLDAQLALSKQKEDGVREESGLKNKVETAHSFAGFEEVVSASNSGNYYSYRGGLTKAHWAYAGKGQHVEWKTEKVQSSFWSRSASFVWAGANSKKISEFSLIFNGKKVMDLASGQATSEEWKSSDITLNFQYVNNKADNAGVYTLTVPYSLVVKGRQQIIRIESNVEEKALAFIMIYCYTDLTE